MFIQAYIIFIYHLLTDFGLCMSRILRKRIVLATVFILSLLYFIVSMFNNPYSHQDKLNSSYIYDYEFADLKRQHHLKDIVSETLADERRRKSKFYHLRPSNVSSGLVDIIESSPSDRFHGIQCRNSVQGKVFLADDRGYVCRRFAFKLNGCCSERHSETQLYSCDTCQTKTNCCAIYEYCISCCMSPNNRELISQIVEDKKDDIFVASISDYFELCLTKCRTSSWSVWHENTYRNPKAKHCFGEVS